MNRKLKIAFISVGAVLFLVGAGSSIAYRSLFGAPQAQADLEQFITPAGSGDVAELIKLLKKKGFIKSETGFRIVYFKTIGVGIFAKTCVDCYSPGAYKISKSMTAWQLAKAMQKPYMKWVVIPEGLRKEQIAEILAKELGWDGQTKKGWITKYTAMNYDYIEGVYFPDTYLIPEDEAPLQVAQRFINKFNEKFQPYADKLVKANIKWDTALKIASIIQREAAGKNDMPLIAGIIWNRLLKDMKLEIDATIQYINDSRQNYLGIQCAEITPCANQDLVYAGENAKKNGWWRPIKPVDVQTASPYNTYLNKGLPPHPISNPGLDAIDAVLNSAETECLYYLHDSNGQIRCSKTYGEHRQNIAKYLQE